MGKHRPIYFDTETTGIKMDRDRIIEIAAYDPVRDETFVSFVNPGVAIPPEATAIHHITDDMVADAPSFKEVGESFCQFCEGDVALIAHNGDGFDIPFLRFEFERHEVEMPKWKSVDSLKWARKYRPDLPRHTLQHLREVYGIPANQAHRALDDVVVLYRIFSQMIDDLHIDQVMELLSKPAGSVSTMPFGKHQGKPLNKVPKDYLKWLAGSGALDKPENASLKEGLEKAGAI